MPRGAATDGAGAGVGDGKTAGDGVVGDAAAGDSALVGDGARDGVSLGIPSGRGRLTGTIRGSTTILRRTFIRMRGEIV